MAQNTVDFSIDPSGDALLDDLLTPQTENILSGNSGTSRPAYAIAGTVWIDTTTTPWVWKMFDGTDDVTLGSLDLTANTFTPSAISIPSSSISNGKLANVSQNTFKGRKNAAGTGSPQDMTASEARTAMDVYSTSEVDSALAALDTGLWTYLASATTTSGTTHDFTIPAGAKDVELMFVGVSTNGTSELLIQLGDAGGVETTGYRSTGMHTSTSGLGAEAVTNGFQFGTTNTAASVYDGSFELSLADPATFLWVAQGQLGADNTTLAYFTAGSKATSAALTTVRVTTVSGDTFDAGAIYARWK